MPFHQYEQRDTEDDAYVSGAQEELKKILSRAREDIAEASLADKVQLDKKVADMYYWRNVNNELKSKNSNLENELENITVAHQLKTMRKEAGLPEDPELTAFINRYPEEDNFQEAIATNEDTIAQNENSLKDQAKDPRVLGEIEKDAYQEKLDREQN